MLLIRGANVNSPAATRSHGLTALQAAWGLLKSMYCLLQPDTPSKVHARSTILQALLDAGANVNVPPSPSGGISAIAAAMESRSLELARSLLGRGADPTIHMNGTTAIGKAVAQGSIESVSLLIEAGAMSMSVTTVMSSPTRGQRHYKRQH
jgi:Ankyrin repeats (3 copies)